ncbi:MAG: cytochrome-c peroxidase [Bacteroidetes bacterium]|nr:MAG: cytochrome-c peroxidase [Bacteroidota bacterium]
MPIRINQKWILLGLASSLYFLACRQGETVLPSEEVWYAREIPYFPPKNIPSDNQLTPERIALGKALFFDPILSRDSSLSCASCHKQEFAFADNKTKTPGIANRPGTRNVPVLFNLVYQDRFLREGSLPTLEMQVLVPIQEHNEFDFNIVDIADKLKLIPFYDSLAKLAYNREPDPFVITRSISAFERTLISADSKYDQVRLGKTKFNQTEELGYSLFKTFCASCHTEPLFTNHQNANNGLYVHYNDPGRYRFTKIPKDSGSFKIPSLRNIAFTAPYMHNGSLKDLDAVILHYNMGGQHGPNQDGRVQALNLNPTQKAALKAFLLTLSDYSFLNDPNFKP